jgi:hypothetical protein
MPACWTSTASCSTRPGCLLDEGDLSAAQIILEVSETGDVNETCRLNEFTKRGRELGFGFAIDDYGRGYAQLKSLYEVEPDILKVDRFFIQSINTDSRKRLMVKTVVDIAHVLGMRVVAEGVETTQELAVCKAIGCDLIQGYLVSRPFQDLEEAEIRYPVVATAVKRTPMMPRDDADLVAREIRPLVPLQDNARMEEVLNLLRAGRANPFHSGDQFERRTPWSDPGKGYQDVRLHAVRPGSPAEPGDEQQPGGVYAPVSGGQRQYPARSARRDGRG